MNGIFVDTGAWYALVDTDDANHGAAAAFLAANPNEGTIRTSSKT